MKANLGRRALVTGAAGFIGSHLTDRLLDLGLEVVGFDNLSSGDLANLAQAMKSTRFRFVQGDLLNSDETMRVLGECELVFHLAANPEVRAGAENPETHFNQNLLATLNLLEATRKRGTSTKLVFASTSTIYGEPTVIPTPEDYGPLLPISVYGATKLGCEALTASYTALLPIKIVIYRFANVVGTRARHGVIYDFIMKLQRDPTSLEVLGDGTQTKSYLHIDDCVNAFLMTLEDTYWRDSVEVFNIGTESQTNVLEIAKTVAGAMRLPKVVIGTTGGRAWPGDVRRMRLDVSRIKKHGWKAVRSSDEAIRMAAAELTQELARSDTQAT